MRKDRIYPHAGFAEGPNHLDLNTNRSKIDGNFSANFFERICCTGNVA